MLPRAPLTRTLGAVRPTASRTQLSALRMPSPPLAGGAKPPMGVARLATSSFRGYRPGMHNHRPWGPGSKGSMGPGYPIPGRQVDLRSIWTAAHRKEFRRNHRFISGVIRLAVSGTVALGVLLVVILCHDAMTYSHQHIDRVPANPLALQPRKGGPKNLPIIEVCLDEEETDEMVALSKKPRLVILGGGWGSVALLKTIEYPDAFNITVIAPQNYFQFTPLLPSACVGTVEPRTLVEPLRRLIARVHGHFLNGSAVDVDMAERLVEVEVPTEAGEGTMRAYVPYDKLVVAVGSRSNDHGVKGLENCYQLKTIPDAQAIRRRIMTSLEMASLPTTTPAERKHLLSFVVCGGGPTGVEFAAELSDMLHEDALKYYPKILKSDIHVTIIQSRDHILNTYSEKISDYAEKRFSRDDIDVVTNARVSEVTPDKVIITVKQDGKSVTKEIPAGFVLWSTGIAMQPFTKRMVERLPNQYHSKAVQVDHHLRVEGAPLGTVYAIGDASTIHLNMINDLLQLWERFDANKDDVLDFDEFTRMAHFMRKKYPLASESLEKIHSLFQECDTDQDEKITLNELAELFLKVSNKVTALPATAQVAAQQGEYLGKLFSKFAKQRQTMLDNEITNLDDEVLQKAFNYKHLGSLAYIGNAAVFDYYGISVAGGLLGMYAWRSVYWGEQTSMRTRVMLFFDWIKRGIFGRDLSRF